MATRNCLRHLKKKKITRPGLIVCYSERKVGGMRSIRRSAFVPTFFLTGNDFRVVCVCVCVGGGGGGGAYIGLLMFLPFSSLEMISVLWLFSSENCNKTDKVGAEVSDGLKFGILGHY